MKLESVGSDLQRSHLLSSQLLCIGRDPYPDEMHFKSSLDKCESTTKIRSHGG